MAGWRISRKVIGPSERPMRFSHPRLSASSTIHLPGWAPLNWTLSVARPAADQPGSADRATGPLQSWVKVSRWRGRMNHSHSE